MLYVFDSNSVINKIKQQKSGNNNITVYTNTNKCTNNSDNNSDAKIPMKN